MSTIDNVAGSVDPLGNQPPAQKSTSGAKESSGHKVDPVRAGERTTTEAPTDTVQISSSRSRPVDLEQTVPNTDAEAAALLEDINRQLQELDQQQLEEVHRLNSGNVVEVLS